MTTLYSLYTIQSEWNRMERNGIEIKQKRMGIKERSRHHASEKNKSQSGAQRHKENKTK